MRLVGPSVAIVRLIPSLLSFLTAVLLALLVRGLFESQCLALATLATLGILPWLFVIGRIGFEVAALPPFLAGFLLVWWKAQNRAAGNASDMDKGLGRWSVAGLSVLAGLLLGLSVYTYATGRLYVGLLVVGLWIGYVGHWRRQGLALVSLTVVVMLAYVPLIVWGSRHPGALTGRFEFLSILCHPAATCRAYPDLAVSIAEDSRPSLLVAAERFVRVYSAAWSPSFLFYSGDPWGRHVTGRGGMLFMSLAPLLPLGVAALWRSRAAPFWRFIALASLLGPVPASLTMHLGHGLRTIETVPFLALIMALGAFETWRALGNQRWLSLGLATLLVVEMSNFLGDYFTSYPSRQRVFFDPGFQEAIATARAAAHMVPILLSQNAGDGYPDIAYAFFTAEEPKAWRSSGVAGGGARTVKLDGAPLRPGAVVITKPDERVSDAEPVRTITFPVQDGWGHTRQEPVYRIWRTK